MIGKLRTSIYKRKGKEWILEESSVASGKLGAQRWKDWKNFDKGLGAKVYMETEGNKLKKYVTYSPDNDRKVIYTKVSE